MPRATLVQLSIALHVKNITIGAEQSEESIMTDVLSGLQKTGKQMRRVVGFSDLRAQSKDLKVLPTPSVQAMQNVRTMHVVSLVHTLVHLRYRKSHGLQTWASFIVRKAFPVLSFHFLLTKKSKQIEQVHVQLVLHLSDHYSKHTSLSNFPFMTSIQKYLSDLAVDHRQEIMLEDRGYRMDRESFDYQCQCDRFSN